MPLPERVELSPAVVELSPRPLLVGESAPAPPGELVELSHGAGSPVAAGAPGTVALGRSGGGGGRPDAAGGGGGGGGRTLGTGALVAAGGAGGGGGGGFLSVPLTQGSVGKAPGGAETVSVWLELVGGGAPLFLSQTLLVMQVTVDVST